MKCTSLCISGVCAFLLAAPLNAAMADDMATKAPAEAKTSNPEPCGSLWDFFTTSCPLTSNGITLYGTIDMGGMFTIIKIRDKLPAGGGDPGWYANPAGTQAREATADELRGDGIDS